MTEFRSLELSGVFEITPPRFGDHRGSFSETYSRHAFAAAGIDTDWVQDNQSFSAQIGTVRGLHFQVPPFAQAKLVRVLRGAIYDVALDIRVGSPTYGEWIGVEISAEKGNQLLVPVGFAHCFMTLRPDTEVFYKVSNRYSKDHEGAIRWDDPALKIDWPSLEEIPTLSDKDRSAPMFADLVSPFKYGECDLTNPRGGTPTAI